MNPQSSSKVIHEDEIDVATVAGENVEVEDS
jgi:hypothetical protein